LLSTLIQRAPSSTLFPYTTLFRSKRLKHGLYKELRNFLHGLWTNKMGFIFFNKLNIFLVSMFGYKFYNMLIGNNDIFSAVPKKKDRKSTRLNSSHVSISYAVFCLN